MTTTSLERVFRIELQERIQTAVLSEFSPLDNKTRYIYHYTNLEGLLGIIQTQYFYASSSVYLNDKKEFVSGRQVFNKNIVGELFDDEICVCLEEKMSQVQSSLKFVTSFSLEKDLLSQWRGYADEGRGISLGIDRLEFKKHLDLNIDGFLVTYKDHEKEEIAIRILSEAFNFFNEKREISSEVITNAFIVNELINIIVRVIGYFKDPAFQEEKEFRFEKSIDLSDNLGEISHRINRQKLIVPYTTIKKKTSPFESNGIPIKEIVIGPSLDFELNKQSIEQILLKAEYDIKQVKIIQSKIPYRI